MVCLWDINKIFGDSVEHCKSTSLTSCLEGIPTKFSDLCCDRRLVFGVSMGAVCYEAGSSVLYHFQFANIFLVIWVPYAGTILQLGSYQGSVGFLFDVSG